VVPRRFLQILAGEGHQPLTTSQSGRLELARWVASADNPLTARVIVNRIWQHHFGSGLVGTSDNFGKRGDKPTHPELLDYLAYELIRKGWSIKHIHRLIVLSNTYQQSCITDAKSLSTDPSNRLLSHFNRRRLDAESLRDALLEVGGTLDHKTGGNDSGELLFKEAESIGAAIRPNRVQTDHPIYTESARRTIYLPVVRNAVPDVLALFDGADPNGVTSSRNETSVASQALFLLNHPFLRRQSDKLAGRVLDQKEASEKERIIRAYRLALGRNPTDGEIIKVEEFLQKYCENARQMGTPRPERLAWQSFCQTLLCRNEFLYVE